MMKKEYNNTIEFNEDDVVYINPSTKGCKTIQKMLTARGVAWVDVLENPNITYIVWTGLKRGSWAHGMGVLSGTPIYSYKEFKHLLDNESRTSLEDTESGVLKLLKSSDDANIRLALTMISTYKADPRWVPWLQLNGHLKEVRVYLRQLGIPVQNGIRKQSYTRRLKREVMRNFNFLAIPSDYKSEFIRDILDL